MDELIFTTYSVFLLKEKRWLIPANETVETEAPAKNLAGLYPSGGRTIPEKFSG